MYPFVREEMREREKERKKRVGGEKEEDAGRKGRK